MNCVVCGIEFQSTRADKKTCSPKCRKDLSRLNSVTDNVTLSEPVVTLNFEYTYHNFDLNMSQPNRKDSLITKKAKYWYDIPISAIPVIKKGWPECPDYMNGRQYFLWWKNNFEVGKGESPFDGPIIFNPYPEHERPVEYIRAGEGSRRLGS